MADINKLDAGSPSPEELERLARFAPGKNFRKAIATYTATFAKQPGPPFLQSGTLSYLSDQVIARALPQRMFYVLRFRVWPIGFDIPDPLRYNNIFAFSNNGQMTLITDTNHLNTFFRAQVRGLQDQQKLNDAAVLWMRFYEELAQDGMFQFAMSTPQVRSGAGTTVVEVHAQVNPQSGNMGELVGIITFDSAGNIANIEDRNTVKAGMRPICQSTKLLDPDPTVRKMAEQDLLIMGKLAKPYLDYQRPRVSPDLQRAIDDIWRRIEAEGR